MFDPASMTAALGSAKIILDLLKNANDAQLAMKISSEVASLQGRLIDVQQQTLALQNENHELRDQIRQMTRAKEEENSFQFMHGVYWKTRIIRGVHKDEEGNQISEQRWEGPFCPLCKDADGKA